MKTLFLVLLLLIGQLPMGVKEKYHLSLADVNAILGQNAELSSQKDSTSADGFYVKINRTYTTDILIKSKVIKSNLFYIFERNINILEATKKMESFIDSNNSSLGYKILTGLGQKAFLQTDNNNFCIIVAQKNEFIIRLKVNNLTPKTNTDALLKVGKDLIDRI
jgi:hypothetical protein